LPRTLISDLPGGFGNSSSRLGAPGRRAAQSWLFDRASLPIWSCSVWGLPCPRHCWRSGALLPHHFTLTPAGATCRPGEPGRKLRSPSPVSKDRTGVAEAVSFLWHWPSASLQARIPDVIRHTALRSSDFPPPENRVSGPPAATARSSCQSLVYRRSGPASCGKGFSKEALRTGYERPKCTFSKISQGGLSLVRVVIKETAKLRRN